MQKERFIGAHVSSAGGLENALINAAALDINTIQIHPSPPQRWNAKPFDDGKENKFMAHFPTSVVKKVFFHGIYLINLANPDKQKFHLSKLSLVNYLDLCSRMQAQGVIFHTGSFKDIEEKERYERVIYGVNWVLEHAENTAPLLLEVAAGAGKVIGSQIEDLARIYEGVNDKKRIAFALDTQHMWASGYDWQNKLDEIVEQLDNVLGLEN
ncbi:deoxyribonuclease IV, partial [Candidatus Dojkabacteria bacterium]|nr:deoxyribonuclease IV [Candidatus Dojkabacteria bacterium]